MSLPLWEDYGVKTWGNRQILVSFLSLKEFTILIKIRNIFPFRHRHILLLLHSGTIACWDLWVTITRALQQVTCRTVVAEPVRSGCTL